MPGIDINTIGIDAQKINNICCCDFVIKYTSNDLHAFEYNN